MANNAFSEVLRVSLSENKNTLETLLLNIQRRYDVNINLHDVIGVGNISSSLEGLFFSHQYHNNQFCNYVKKHNPAFKRCVENKEKLCIHCRKVKAPFYGTCYMGIDEFVHPVFCEDKLIAIICIGQFCADKDRSSKKILNASPDNYIDSFQTQKLFNDSVKEIGFNVKEFIDDTAILAEMILLTFTTDLNRNSITLRNTINETLSIQKGNFILNNTVKFIAENYDKELSLKLIASNSYCNHTYLSYLFKEKMNIGIIDYINKIRIDKARELLDITNLSITEISSSVGFNDSGYFTRVFKNATGSTPKEYRERNT